MYANMTSSSNIRLELEDKMTVVGYCRLSRDEDKENYSSIEEQELLLNMQVVVIGLSLTSI